MLSTTWTKDRWSCVGLTSYQLRKTAKDSEITLWSEQHTSSAMCTRWTATEYCELRDLVLSRVTLFNVRRGGKPTRLWHFRNGTAQCSWWWMARHKQHRPLQWHRTPNVQQLQTHLSNWKEQPLGADIVSIDHYNCHGKVNWHFNAAMCGN